jgi:hypothetical protein
MALLQPGLARTFQLQPGETLLISTDSASACRYGLLTPPPPGSAVGEQPSAAPVSVPASSAITVGPRGDVSRWLIDSVVGPGCSVTQNSAASVPDVGAPPDVQHIYGAGAPSAATGANQASTASLYSDVSAGKLYINSGSKTSPSWRLVTSA